VRIAAELLDEVMAHAQEDAIECCGLVGVDGTGEAQAVYRARNARGSTHAFEIAPLELARLLASIEADGYRPGAVYHSHTSAMPYPSETDIGFAEGWPGIDWLIVGRVGSAWRARCYSIKDGDVQLRPLLVT
jgi:proteasome lid subunit RPN8/RPN11